MDTNTTKLYGLIGYPVKHSLSAFMHEAAFKDQGIKAEYKLFPVKPEELEGFILGKTLIKDIEGKEFNSADIAGFNITIPHKVKAREILEKMFPFDQSAYMVQEDLYYVKLSGAINTVKREEEFRNTDAEGFLTSLYEDFKFDTNDKTALVIGCGGAGRAIIASLSWKDVKIKKIYVNDISGEAMNSAKVHFSQFSHLKDRIEFIASENIAECIQGCDLLINASPIGMEERDGFVIRKDLMHKGLHVYDVVYNRKTQLIKDAEEVGLPAMNGLRMLLRQGMGAFNFWTKKKPPEEIMWEALCSHL